MANGMDMNVMYMNGHIKEKICNFMTYVRTYVSMHDLSYIHCLFIVSDIPARQFNVPHRSFHDGDFQESRSGGIVIDRLVV